MGPEDLYCHRCLPKKVPMSKVCHTCDLWMSVRGKDKNTGRDVDEWMCADRAEILWLAEIAKNSLSEVAATENFRNEMVSANLAYLNVAASARNAARQQIAAVEKEPTTLMLEMKGERYGRSHE
jgi:hypothetical protein